MNTYQIVAARAALGSLISDAGGGAELLFYQAFDALLQLERACPQEEVLAAFVAQAELRDSWEIA